jgi:putative flavoprotein involved in K+ transport
VTTVDRMTTTTAHFVEQGAAFMEIADAARESFEVIVIGAGQAGLSVGYHLARRKVPFLIVDGCERIGDTWRKRWDSLRLFTPARFDGLAGMPFPAPPHSFPTKDQMADYLEAYAARFELPVRTGFRVRRLWREGGRYVMTDGRRMLSADQVVIAMADFQHGRVPAFAAELDPAIVQIHAGAYRNPSQLAAGDVLIVGAGNSGAEIALDVARDRRVWVSGRDVGQVPFRIDGLPGRHVLAPLLLRFVFHRVLTVHTPPGRKMRAKLLSQGGPLIRTRREDLAAAGVTHVQRTVGSAAGRPLLEDGRVLDVANVIWCTGFHPGFSWIDLPVLDERGRPRHQSGVADDEPGLYFVGLMFTHAASSVMIHGVGRDAGRVAETIATSAGHHRGFGAGVSSSASSAR